MRLADDLASAADPVALARRIGIAPDAWQADVMRSAAKRSLVCAGRQVGKSTCASLRALHVALFRPEALVLLIAPSQRQSAELFGAVRAAYRRIGRPVESETESVLSIRLENGSRIVALPGSESTIRGFAAPQLVVLDEAARISDDLYAAVIPMLSVSGAPLLAISTPNGRRGWFYDAWSGRGNWQRTTIRSDECARISGEYLVEARESMSDLAYKQEFLCEFVEPSGSCFTADDVVSLFSDDVVPLFAKVSA